MPSEFDFIDWIRKQQRPTPLVQLGVGDDMAILNWPANDLLLIGVDQVLDGVHFDSRIHTPTQFGKKVMNRNLSDCAAMACLPAAAVATLAAPRDFSLAKSQEFYIAMHTAADAFNCPIVGGDTSVWDGKLLATVTILGRSAGVKPITRAGAKPGDGIFVTGPLGGSILGRHLDFTPRVDFGRQLASFATAMIDTSDGISRDITHICKASQVGAIIESANIPIHNDARELSRRDGISPLDHAMNDGEDYELLFTSTTQPPVGIRLGRIVSEQGVWLEASDGNRIPLAAKGWEHTIR